MPAPLGPIVRPRRTYLRSLPLRLVEALRERASRASSSRVWAAACLAALLAAGRAHAQAPSPDQWITNGSVLTHVLIDSTLYVGGSFTAVGGVTGAGVPVDSVTALPTAGFPVVNGSVFAAIPDGAGGWFLGGQFTSVGGVARTNLARVLANGALSSWSPVADAPVRALALSGSTLYVGGDFLTLGGVARNRVGAVDITTGVTSAWNPNANASVRALAVGTAAVYIGGQYTTIGGAAITRLAQVNTTTGAVNTSWIPNPNNTVFALALNEAAGVLYAGGQFTILDGVTRNRIAQLESATGLATLWNAGSNNTVLSIALSPSAVYIGGLFTQIGTSLRNRLAALSPTTGTPNTWNPGADNTVQTMTYSNGLLYVGGDFLNVSGVARSRAAALNGTTGAATAWDPTAYGTVSTLPAARGKVLIGGTFNGVGGLPRRNAAAFNVRTGQATAWAPDVNNVIQTMVAGTSSMFLGGSFTAIGTAGRTSLGEVDLVTGQPTTWAPACNGQVLSLARTNDRLYVGGLYTSLGGAPHTNLGAVDLTTGLASAWTADASDQVYALDANGPSLLVGGNFLVLGGVNRSFVGAVDLASGVTTAWAPEANAGPRTFVRLCDRILVGGNFTSIGGQLRNRAAALDPTTGAALPWNPDANATVFAIHAQPGVVYLGGSMTLVGGQARNRAAAVDPATGVLLPWNPNANGIVRAFAQSGSRVLMSGSFSAVNAQPSGTVASVPNEASATCGNLAITPGDLPVLPLGAPGSITLTVSGGTAPFCWKLSSGTLPAGLTFDTATGVLSGTPTTKSATVLGFTATDARGCSTVLTDTLITRLAGGLAFVTEPTTVAAGAAIVPAVRVRVRNLLGDPAVGSPVTISMQGTGILSGVRTVLADTAGIATFADVRFDLVGSKQLVAQADSIPQLPAVTSAIFKVTAGPVALLAFTATPDSGVAGVALTPTTVVRAQDAFGNLVPGANVVLSLASGDSLTGLSTVATDSLGLARFTTLSVHHAASQRLVATVGGVQANSPAFLVRPAAPATLTFTTPPSDHIAGQTMAAVAVRTSDAFGNPVPGTTVQLSLVGTGVLSGTFTTTSDSTGIAHFADLTSDRSGLQQLLASSGTLALTSPRYRVSPATAASLAFTTQPSAVVAGVAITPSVTVIAHDAFGNGVPGVAIALSMSGTGTLTGDATASTDSTGMASYAGLSVDLVGDKTLTATSDLLTATSHAFTVSPAAAASLAFTTQPSAVIAGVAMAPAVRVVAHDAFGNNVPGVSVALAMTGSGALNGGTDVLTDASGTATYSSVSVDLVGSKTLTASIGLLTATSDAFVVSHAAAASLAFTAQPSAVVAGVVMTPAVTVIARDLFGNAVPGIPVALTMNGTGTLAGGTAVVTDVTGTATYSALSVDLVGLKTLTATSDLLSATSSAFSVSPAAAASLAFTTQPSAVVAGVAMAPAVTVVARDAFGNVVPGVSVALTMTGTGTLTGGAAASTDSTGLAAYAGLSVDLVGDKMLTATSDLITATSHAFIVSPASAASLAFMTQPSAVVAGVAIEPAVQVIAHDAFGNTVPGTSVALTLTGTGTLTGGAAVNTDATGTATYSALSVNLVGRKTLTATSGLVTATSSAFAVSPAAAASLAFTTQPSAVVAGVAVAPSVKVLAHDAFGNSVPGVSIALSMSGTGTLTGGAAVSTDSTGTATYGAVSVNLVGSKKLTATSSLLTATSSAFTVSPAAAASLAFTTQPSAVIAGVAIAPAVQVVAHDAFGNNVPGVSIALSMTGSGALNGGAAASTDSLGTAHFGALSLDLVGSKSLTASSDLLTATSDAFVVSHAAAASLAFTTQPSAVVAGVSITPAITIVAHDAFGNIVPGVSVALSLVGTGTLTGGATVSTDSTGAATYGAVSVNLIGSKTLTATSGLLSATSSAFTVSPAAAASLAFTTQPSAVVAGVAIAPAVTVSARDAFGNLVPGLTVDLALTGAGTLSGVASATTDATGVTTYATLSVDLVGSKGLTATSGSLMDTSSTFAVVPAPAASLAFTTQPSAVVAGVAIEPAVQVIAHDAFGNTVPGTSVALALNGSGVLTGGDAVASDSTGIATFSALSLTLVGDKTLTARTDAIATTSASFPVSASAPATLAFLTPPSDVIAGIAIAPAVRIAVTDAFGNVVPSGVLTVSEPDGSTLAGSATTASDSSGIATFTDLVLTRAGRHTLLVASGAHSASSDSFTVAAAAPATLAFVTPPSTAIAGLAIAPTVTVVAHDAFANPVPAATVGLALEGAGSLMGDTVSVTDAQGLAAFPTIAVDRVGEHALRASIDMLTSLSPSFTITPGAPATLMFPAPPSDMIAGGVMSPAVQVLAHDAFGNPVPRADVTLAAASLTGGETVPTDTLGLATFPSLSLTLAGSHTLTATNGTASSTSPSFLVSPASPASLTFVVAPSDVVAGDAMAPAVQVLAQDRFGNTTPDAAVSLALDGSGTLLGGASVRTDAQGRASFADLTVDRMGRKALTASLDSLQVTSSSFAVAPATATTLAFAATPADAVAGVVLSPAVEVQAQDRFGNPALGSTVQLALTAPGQLSGLTSASVDSLGMVAFSALSIDRAGAHTLAATSGSAQATSDTFHVTHAAAARLTFTTSPSDVEAGAPMTPSVQVTVLDAFDNPVRGTAVALSLMGEGTLVGGDARSSDDAGRVTFDALVFDRAGSHTLIATSSALSSSSTSFTVRPATVTSLAFLTAPSDVVAGGVMSPAVRVEARDAYTNPVPGASITLSLEGPGSLSGTLTVATSADGVASFSDLTLDHAGLTSLTAHHDVLTLTSGMFHVSPAPPATLTFVSQPGASVAGDAIAPAVTVLVKDAFANVVPGATVVISHLGTGTLTGTTSATSDSTGLASFSALVLDRAGVQRLSAASGVAQATSAPFALAAAAADHLTFVTDPSDAVAGVALSPAVTVLVEDRFGNAVAGHEVALTLDADTLTVGRATRTDAAGLATFADVHVGAMGAHTLRTRSTGLPVIVSRTFVIGAAPAASLSFVVAPTTTVAGATMAPAVQVRALDAYGNPVAGLPIALATSGASTLTGGAAVPSDANGVASFAGLQLTLAGSHTLLASSGALTATSTPFAILAATPRSMAFAVAPTNAVAGAVLTPAVQVKVSDVYGNGVPAVSVALAVTGGGTLTGGAATPTGTDGLATFAGLAVDLAGSHTLVAQSTGLTFVASPTFVIAPGVARTLTFTTQPTSATAGATLSPPVRVRVTDAFGNGVAGTGVSVAMSDGTPLAGNLSTTSNTAGFATFGTLSSTVAGPHTLTASSGSLTPAISATFTITSGGVASLTFVSQPTDARAGTTLSPALRVRASDAYGNRVAGGSISLALTGGGTLAGSVAMPSDSDGVATFADLMVDRAGHHTLVATLGTVTTTSATFAITPSSPAAVAFAVEPSDATAGTAMTPGVQVRVTDAFANPVPDAFVSLALGTPGTLAGADSLRTDAQGLARFTALRVTEVGTHTLVAQQGALRVDSRGFRITAAGAATIAWQVQPSAAQVATVLSPAPEVLVRDAYGNVVPGAPVTLTLVGSGALTGGAATSDAQGVARFASLRVDRAGVMQLLAGSGAATSSASVTFTVSCPELVLSALGVDSTSAGVPFARTLSTTGGTAPYRYAVTAGTLPAGLTLAADGVLRGSPSVSGTAMFTVSATDSFACTVSRGYALTVVAVPVAISDLTVTRAPGVGDGDGTLGLRLAFTPSPAATRIEVYRAPFGGYPLYDEAGGCDPLASVYPPSAPWVRTSITASGQIDETPVRDAYAYVVYQVNALGQVSAASNHTVPMPNYRLGDNSNGRVLGAGDNRVDLADLSLLGAHYGIGAATMAADSLQYLDVGPTLDHTLKCRPTTDGRVDFEDLAVLATEYGNEAGTTSFVAQANGMIRRAQGAERVSYDAPDQVRADETFAVVLRLEGAGRLQAISAQLVWDEAVVEPVAMEPSDWVAAQDGMTFSARPGNVDAAILGVHERGFVGAGILATVRFRARRDGAPGIQLGHVEGRDAANRGLSSELLTVAQRELVPTQTVQFAPTPNPSRGEATLAFALATPGRVEFDLFGVDGRHVRSFANGPHAAGRYSLRWNGDDDQHRRVAPGVYFARLVTPDHRSTRRIVVLP